MSINKTDNRPNAIVVTDIKKAFRLPHENHSGLKQMLINLTRKNSNKGYEVQQVLKGVSFEVKKGDFFGIVGRNGSGKSTLLKLLAGIYTPDSGVIQTNGSVVPFIELGVGFNPELTGRENVFLNGALLGFSRDEMKAMYDDIVEFAELERFMDQKLKNYSSGMQVRLAFSIAIQAKGDILILDEVLAVGDEAFQRKCDNFFDQIKKDKSKTVILVTHSMASVKKYCNRAILVKDGKILISGDPSDVANQYTEENTVSSADTQSGRKDGLHQIGLSDRVPVLRNVPISKKVLPRYQNFEFEIEYEFREDMPFYVGYTLMDVNRGGIVYDSGMIPVNKRGRHKIIQTLPLTLFNDSDFQIITSLRVDDGQGKKEMIAYTSQVNSCYFSVRSDDGGANYALLRSLKG